MKKIIYLLALVVFSASIANAQKKKSRDQKKRDKTEEYIEKLFGDSDKDFDVMNAPEKWRDESVVILCQKYYFYYDNPSQIATTRLTNEVKGAVRKRLLIQDKSALEDYSEYYYQDGGSVGFNVIKPDGAISELNFEDAVEVKKDIPSYYRSKYRSGSYYKIAIPNLEIGDIIDYFVVYTDEVGLIVSDVATVSEEYPIVKQEFIFDVPKGWKFNHKSFNGAPELTKLASGGFNKSGKAKKKVRRFVFQDSDREAASSDRWDMPYLTEPTIKILSVFSGHVGGYRIESDLHEVENLFKFNYNSYYQTATGFANGALMNSNIKKLKEKPLEERVNTLYNILKYRFLSVNMTQDNQKKLKDGDVMPYSQDYSNMYDGYFAMAFVKMLEKYKVKSDYVLIVPKHYGFVEDALTPEEYVLGVYIPSLDKYYFAMDNYSIAGEKRRLLYGATGYRWDSKNKTIWKKKIKLDEFELPESTPSENVVKSNITVNISDDKKINVEKEIEYLGVFKKLYGPFLLYNTTFVYDELYEVSKKTVQKKLAAYNNKESFKKNDWRAKRYKKKRAEQEEEIKEFNEKKFENVENWVKDQYEIEEILDFELLDAGMKSEKPLTVKYSFETDEYIKKAGPNLIFDVGTLITSQVELSEKEINERTKPVEISYARTIENSISVNIPAGKTIEGVEALNITVDNDAASFISSASIDKNVLKIEVSKVYKQEFLPIEKWKDLVEMLEAAYKFSQLKVVMK